MIKIIYIGSVISKKEPFKVKTVSASTSKLEAGNLLEEWIKAYDPQKLSWDIDGVDKVSGQDYIKIEEPKSADPLFHNNHPKFNFGDRLKFGQKRIGTVMGIEYRDIGNIIRIDERDKLSGGEGKLGWWYGVRWDGKRSIQNVHEDLLTKV